ncbi:efflux transporter periplasmic adaptor subunit [Longibacter salinarum]|uniref:Efflux transporter periplasmic adaptor subunit n=2 Tax=Longibacter salinarum TaxID=1850348 RepID=A0A2A8D095_9BACT|nr:efflux transporter periplasmic adaptor subunit [Longibacter salinarum]
MHTVLICAGIIAGAAVLMALIFSTEPTAQTSGATKESAMLVDVITLERDTIRPTIRAMGTVRPVDEIVLSPRVEGQIIDRSAAFDPGRDVQEGDILVQIDPSDYRNALQQRQSELQQAESDLKLEMGRQNVARQDYKLLDDTLAEENQDLVLRRPQLQAAQSEVESARAAVQQARLALNRTTIRAPFDAHVLERNVSVGSQVQPSDPIASLVGRDRYWVEATVPLSHLQWLSTSTSMEEATANGSAVRIRNRTAWMDDQYRTGYLARRIGALEDRTRMARVLISVPDPGATRPEHQDAPPLMLGSYVEAQIPAEPLPDVIRLNRDFLRADDTVWIMDADTLRIENVDVVLKDAVYAYVRDGIEENDRIITSTLATVREGAPLRLASDTSDTSDEKRLPDPSR